MMDISTMNNSPSTGPLRRSSRLYSSNWVKENTTTNNTKASKMTRTPTKRSRRTISFEKDVDQKMDMNDLGKSNENLKGGFVYND